MTTTRCLAILIAWSLLTTATNNARSVAIGAEGSPPNPIAETAHGSIAGGDAPGGPSATDIAIDTGFQKPLGVLQRGRALVAADFDLDGWIDFYVGNPGDTCFTLRNLGADENGGIQFEVQQVLLMNELSWGAASADYDNDGDFDLFVPCGGNEGNGPCFLFKNMRMETGIWSFADVTDEAGVRGWIPPGFDDPVEQPHANAEWADYNSDGHVDLFVNVNILGSPPWPAGRNLLWENNGDGTFTDVTDEAGLGASLRPTRHSSFIDFDNDGDLDLYENNWLDSNVLWRNMLVEDGTAAFLDATMDASGPGQNIGSAVFASFVSAMYDFNQDGWQDLIAFMKGDAPPDELYSGGHILFRNFEGEFGNVAEPWQINEPYIGALGVMGSQLGDLNGDGFPEIFIGNGGPSAGENNQLFVSNANASLLGGQVQYVNKSMMIDFPSPEDGVTSYPPFPYRTHGTCIVDVDNDGQLEMAVINGGPAGAPDVVREPNRLYKFEWGEPFNYIKIRPVGNGLTVSRDGIGVRVSVTASEDGTNPQTFYGTLTGGSAFSAQNGFELYFGIRQNNQIDEVEIQWPDGFVTTINEGLDVNTSVSVARNEPGDADGDDDVDADDHGQLTSLVTGPAEVVNPVNAPGELSLDMDFDGDVDLHDIAEFAILFGTKY